MHDGGTLLRVEPLEDLLDVDHVTPGSPACLVLGRGLGQRHAVVEEGRHVGFDPTFERGQLHRPTPSLWTPTSVGPMFTLVVRFDLPDAAAASAFDRLAADTIPVIREREQGR